MISAKPTRRPARGLADYVSLLGAGAALFLAAFLGAIIWAFSPEDVGVQPVGPAVAVPGPEAAMPDRVAEPTFKDRVRTAVEPVVNLPAKVANPLDFIPDWPLDRPVTILLLGTDKRDGDPFGKTDTIMVLRVDPEANSGVLVSIPRDVCLSGCDGEPYRINTVLFLEGPDGLRRRVSEMLGFNVDYQVTMDFAGFVQLVDFFGGVEIDVPRDIRDYSYPNKADDGFDPFLLRAGRHRMGGEIALKYVRTRWEDPESDFGRIRRQQQFLLALRDQILTPKLIVQAPSLVGRLARTFDSNLPLMSIPSLAKLAMHIKPEAFKLASIDYTDSRVYPAEAANGAQVLIPNVDRIRHFVAQTAAEAKAQGGSSEDLALEPMVRQQLEP